MRAPIGVFDSGVGGLSVARRIAERLPGEPILYLADQAHVPYGGRPLAEVRGFAGALTRFLLAAGARMVVMACNISSATALPAAERTHGPRRVLGVIGPGAQAALQASKNGRVGVLATAGTVATGAYTAALRTGDPAARTLEVACPRFVPLIEAGAHASPEAREAAREYLAPVLAFGADTVVLGCTHYPFLRPILEETAPGVCFVDPAEATVDRLLQLLEPGPRPQSAPPPRLLTTGDPARFGAQLALFWPGLEGGVETVPWDRITEAAERAPLVERPAG